MNRRSSAWRSVHRRTVIVSVKISQKQCGQMQSFLDQDKPQRLFKRKCTDFMRVVEFYVEFVQFNKRSSSFIERPASWRDCQTVQVSVCFQNYSTVIYISLLSTISGVIFIFFFLSTILLFFLWNDFFFLQEQFEPSPPLLHFFFVFMKSYKYRHLLTMNSTGDLCQQLFLSSFLTVD